MFEGLISPAVADPGTPGALRPLEWGELVARFSAARDLRAAFARPLPGAASFADRARAGLSHQSGAPGERQINLEALGHRKTPAPISRANVKEAAEGDQGTR